MEYQLLKGTMIASQDEKTGEWIYKANENNQLKPFKKNRSLKAVYRDLPRFKCISQYEDQEEKDYKQSLQKQREPIVFEKKELPQRSTRGLRMSALVGKAQEEDEQFY